MESVERFWCEPSVAADEAGEVHSEAERGKVARFKRMAVSMSRDGDSSPERH